MGSVFHWFWCPCQRDFADCVRMAPPADTCSEVAVELRCWREEGRQRFGDCFFLDVVWKVVDNFSSCQACVTVVQNDSNYSCKGERMIHSAIVRPWPGNSPCRTRAQRLRLPSL